jgi:hypothetical protein
MFITISFLRSIAFFSAAWACAPSPAESPCRIASSTSGDLFVISNGYVAHLHLRAHGPTHGFFVSLLSVHHSLTKCHARIVENLGVLWIVD